MLTPWICQTCCAQFVPSEVPPAMCPICADERQYIGASGQRWTSMDEIAREHRNDWREIEPGLSGIGVAPAIGIGQRALLVQTAQGNVLWDCTPLVEPETAARIKALGRVVAMAISHPHFYGAMVSWSEALGGVPILLPEADAAYVMRPSPLIKFWSGDQYDILPGVSIIRCGGHFSGSSVLHVAGLAEGKGAILSGDTVNVVPATGWVSFMRSYPNLIPLPARTVRDIALRLEPLAFERIYGAWWDKVVESDGHDVVRRSAERYIRALD